MPKYWTREDTKEWILHLENRIEDIDYYLKKTVEWCESNFIHDDRKVFICSFLTCVWVSQMRDEPISYVELLEILGVKDIDLANDRIYIMEDRFKNINHEELLRLASEHLDDV